MTSVIETLNQFGIQPTPQRIAVAEFVLKTDTHPTADEVWAQVRQSCPTLSRATVYNTLNLFAEKGLLRTQPLKEGVVVFDPRVNPHHHFIDEESGQVFDVPWDAVKVTGEDQLGEFEVREYQVVLRGRRRT
ncbi:MAG TPA: transcriptional repressor [Nitrospirota bacterium]|nr:transcriptional repressor [Nitrospirota bacterium]